MYCKARTTIAVLRRGSFWQLFGTPWQVRVPRVGSMSVCSSGLYAVKPRFQQLLSGPADALVARGVHPDVLTFAGLMCAIAGGAAVAAGVAQPTLLWLVP